MEPAERRPQDAHDTTERNILKVIVPLFLDYLRAEFRSSQARRDGRAVADLRRFRDRLGTLRLFDPACGWGNFLIHRLPRASHAGDRRAARDSLPDFRPESSSVWASSVRGVFATVQGSSAESVGRIEVLLKRGVGLCSRPVSTSRAAIGNGRFQPSTKPGRSVLWSQSLQR